MTSGFTGVATSVAAISSFAGTTLADRSSHQVPTLVRARTSLGCWTSTVLVPSTYLTVFCQLRPYLATGWRYGPLRLSA
jgi:hypothetical protein